MAWFIRTVHAIYEISPAAKAVDAWWMIFSDCERPTSLK
jgi:hypothetical protein